MAAYYNEHDKGAAAWLRVLIQEGLIAHGYVDERSIEEVTPADLHGFTQCHFFAGIGGWSLALRIAGVADDTACWTGSPPCQPFSVAGKKLGQLDERHLAPTFMRLVAQCKPAILFGEQVAAAIKKHWLDDLFTELEREGYACGASVLPACSVGAPHKRDRLFFGASLRMGDTASQRQCANEAGQYSLDGEQLEGAEQGQYDQHGCADGSVADTNDARPQGRSGMPERADQQPAGAAGLEGSMADAKSHRRADGSAQSGGRDQVFAETTKVIGVGDRGITDATNQNHGFWSDADWLGCRDGKFRPVESGTFPLADGISARVGRLRGYGNAIVPQVAAEFIKAFNGAIIDARRS